MSAVLDFEFTVPQVNVPGPMPRVRFFVKPDHHPGKSAEAGRDIFLDTEYVSVVNPGSKDEFVKKVDDKTRKQYAQQYEHWKATNKELIKGEGFTPLSEVSFIRPSQLEELRMINILTVENLAALPESSYHRVGPGVRDLVSKAKAWLEQAKDMAFATRMAAENEGLKRDMDMMKKQMADVNAKFEQMMREQNGVAS